MADDQDEKQVVVTFSTKQLDDLKRVAEMQGISVAAALRQALDLSTFLVNAKAERNTKILIKRGNALQELELAS